MNRKEIRDIKKRFNDEMDNFSKVYGCYVNAAKEVVAEIDLQVLDMDNEEKELYSKILKKVLSGTQGKNLIELGFDCMTAEGDLLMSLKNSHLKVQEKRREFFNKIIETINLPETSYVILLLADSYDIPHKGVDDEFADESYDMFDYFICAVCPVKDPKAALRYMSEDKNFRGTSTGSVLGAPQLGFMYPALEDGAGDLGRALYYTRSSSDIHKEIIDSVFNAVEVPMSQEQQMNAFSGALEEALGDECSIDVVKVLQSRIITNLAEHKESNDPEAPAMYINEIQEVLKESGVSEEKADGFKEVCQRYLGDSPTVNPNNLMNSKVLEIKNQEVDLKVDPDFAFQIKTQVIDGRNYILVPVGIGLTVNGVEVTCEDASVSEVAMEAISE